MTWVAHGIHGLNVSLTHFILAEILVLVGGAIPPAPAVSASTSTRIYVGPQHSSPVNIGRRGQRRTAQLCPTRHPVFTLHIRSHLHVSEVFTPISISRLVRLYYNIN